MAQQALHNHGIFNPLPEHLYIVMFHDAKPEIRVEEDHSLYFDDESLSLFIVISRECESGPNVSCHHSIYPLEEYVKAQPMMKAKLISAFRRCLSKPSQ